MKLKLVIQAPGGKFSGASQLLPYFPDDFQAYREPFAYSAGVFAHVPPTIRRWISDVNPAPIRVFQRLRDDPAFLEELVQLREIPRDQLLAEFHRRKQLCRPENFDEASYVFVSAYAYRGMVRPRMRPLEVAHPSENDRFKRICTPDRQSLLTWRSLLQNAEIRCCNYSEALERPGRKCLLYLDPPYNLMAGLYDYTFTPRDWYELQYWLRRCRHRFLMTVGADQMMRDLFNRFTINDRYYHGCYGRNGFVRHDLIVTNYDPPCAGRGLANAG